MGVCTCDKRSHLRGMPVRVAGQAKDALPCRSRPKETSQTDPVRGKKVRGVGRDLARLVPNRAKRPLKTTRVRARVHT